VPKFLLIRFSSIGDIVLTTPIIRAIKTQLKDSEIHYLTKNQFVQLVNANPYIDKVFAFNKSMNETIRELQEENYTSIIDLHKNLRSAQVILSLRKKHISFNKLNIEKWIRIHLKVNTLPDLHLIDRYFISLSELGIQKDENGLDYFFQKDFDTEEYNQWTNQAFMAWAIGGTYFTKQFPFRKIKEILSKLALPCVLLGGKEDRQRGEFIAEGLPNVWNLCGKTSLDQSAYLLKTAKLVLTNDTGLMHIAAAFNKETIAFWGNTIPEFGMFAYQQTENVKNFEIKNLSCRPCSKLGHKECPKRHFRCMEGLENESIIKEIEFRMTK
jgi:ADP-heptose:LPS heptosyltransferase